MEKTTKNPGQDINVDLITLSCTKPLLLKINLEDWWVPQTL